MVSAWFRSRDGRVEAASPQAWAWIASRVSRLWDVEGHLSGHYSGLLLDFVNAAEQAAEERLTRPVSLPKPAPVVPARLEEIDTEEAARRMQCSQQYVRRLARAGRISGRIVGHCWLIDASSIDRQAAS